ncbi:MAG: DEAD/DEAH box helicase family protein [Erysipelothrix sp.]|nr:DEAD/DEAH box helicase family protein [Erysipelothrix sp.]
MKCKRCNNQDLRYFFLLKKEYVCRKCLMFNVGLLDKELYSYSEDLDAEYQLGFDLTKEQKVLSKKVVENIMAKKDVLIFAACGSGKTEIILKTIKYGLDNKLKVGIAIPRRQVVLQLSERLSEYFSKIKIVSVCEGYTKELFADLIICTTHQLHNYPNYFDILIIDEPDAFPFADNPLLQALAKNSVKGNTVYMTATPTKQMKQLETLTLFKRYHGHDLLVPKVVIAFKPILLLKMYKWITLNKKVLLFVPTIALAQKLSKILGYPAIHSKSDAKDEIINQFEQGEFNVLVTTTIMERGITIEGVNICVLYADHPVFNQASLIQIAGRVGRKASAPNGFGIFLCENKSEKVDLCIAELEMMNA